MAQMTIKQAAEFLKDVGKPFSPVTLRKAITDGKLKATMHSVPTEYYVIEESDLMAWVNNPKFHYRGRVKVNYPGDPNDPMYKKK